jgi:hypothetical protein
MTVRQRRRWLPTARGSGDVRYIAPVMFKNTPW